MMIQYGKQDIDENDIDAVVKVFEILTKAHKYQRLNNHLKVRLLE